MERHIREYYSAFSDDTPSGNFHAVVPLHEEMDLSWDEVQAKVPRLCKGWYELVHLSVGDRIDFICDFWLTQLPFHPDLKDFLIRFFEGIDDIGVYLYQKKFEDPFSAELVYSCQGGEVFYRGRIGAAEEEVGRLQREFPDYIFPEDYIKFLQIHDGFSKTTDVTGILPCSSLKETYLNFQEMLDSQGNLTTTSGAMAEPKALIPFYESFGMPFFQCFYGEWYPQQEMGNVYYSGLTNTISDINVQTGSENMVFPTYLDWLMFYLERVE